MTFQPGRGRPSKARQNMDAVQSAMNVWHRDGWTNVLSGMGTQAKDKREHTFFLADLVPYERAQEIWRGSDLAANFIERLPKEMTREGWRFCVSEDAEGNDESYGVELAAKIEQKWDELGLINAVYEALCMQRAYGGSAIFIGADDGQDPSEPLNLKAVRSIDWLTVMEPRELCPLDWYTNPRAPKFGQPATYQLTPIVSGNPRPGDPVSSELIRVHESRLLIFQGIKTSRIPQRGQFNFWGDSILTRVITVLRDFNTAWSAAGSLVADFAPAVMKIKELAKIMAQNQKELFAARMQAVHMARGTAGVTLLDAEEEYSRQQTPVTGLAELLQLFARRWTAACDTPFEISFGEAAGGINASGASSNQLRSWYDRAHSEQSRELLPKLRYLTNIILHVLGGEPEDWSIEFNPLWQPTDAEMVASRKTQMEIDTGYHAINVCSSDEIRRNRFSHDKFSYDMRLESLEPDELQLPENENAEPLAGVGAPEPAIAPAGGTPSADLAKEAFNGTQVEALISVVTAVNASTISRSSGKSMLMLAFQLSAEEAEGVLGPIDFEASKPEPAPNPFAKAPAEKPAAAEKPEGEPEPLPTKPTNEKVQPPSEE